MRKLFSRSIEARRSNFMLQLLYMHMQFTDLLTSKIFLLRFSLQTVFFWITKPIVLTLET